MSEERREYEAVNLYDKFMDGIEPSRLQDVLDILDDIEDEIADILKDEFEIEDSYLDVVSIMSFCKDKYCRSLDFIVANSLCHDINISKDNLMTEFMVNQYDVYKFKLVEISVGINNGLYLPLWINYKRVDLLPLMVDIETNLYVVNENKYIMCVDPNSGKVSFEDEYYEDKKKIDDNINLTEGLIINKKGDLKFTFEANKNYMDQYMELHREFTILYNSDSIEQMKQIMAMMFALISKIERDKTYKNRSNKDAINARANLINDFKKGMDKILSKQPNFVFTDYYKKSNLDKLVVDIPIESVKGIRSLFNVILGRY